MYGAESLDCSEHDLSATISLHRSAAETLFIDDRPEHVAAAVKLGMAGHAYTDVEALQQELAAHRIL